MTPEALFGICNLAALLGWVLLATLPRRPWVPGLVTGTLMPLLFALIYAGLIVTFFRGAKGGFSTLDDVALLFSNRWVLVAGWVHYLAFDLFIGSWEVRDAVRRGVPHLLVLPCLALTFFFGPIGLATWFAVREVWTRTRG